MDRISELPKHILQRILYFLSQEDAVRTSVLSKLWRNIWCTRPNLDFSDNTFKGNKRKFLSVLDTTLQRYCDQEDQGLCLEKFHLRISLDDPYQESVSLLEKWVPRFTTMGVKTFRLSVVSNNVHLDLSSVVFKAEPLKRLRLRSCNLGRDIPDNIPFVRLTQEILDKIISSCPLLTTMSFVDCRDLTSVKLETKLHKNLKRFTFHTTDECSVEIDDIPTLEKIDILGCKVHFHSHEFTNLEYLSLHSVEISSNSIEESDQVLCIDAPNVNYFEYMGNFTPSISFAPTSNKGRWSSNVRFYVQEVEDAQSCLVKLSKQLQALTNSEISLEIIQYSDDNIAHVGEDVLVLQGGGGDYKPVAVEHLKLNCIHVSSLPPFFNCLFCICRPKKITRRWWSTMQGELLIKREQKELIEYFCIIRERGIQDLEDLSIGILDNSRRKWKRLSLRGPISWESALLDVDRICIRLKWRESCESSSKLLEL
ncbi:hypothetical protein MIMGU_mgv1a021107mg [Erythranthe guttata]|uniref:F-box domain-containing protein n=1 Tax=Erythranthe guttata TaxID=4155 RepID=A0A022QUH5_ERYGU|nr:hypothetical protein MIMGU_mgv1a021107mg [Erythranthe guttata]